MCCVCEFVYSLHTVLCVFIHVLNLFVTSPPLNRSFVFFPSLPLSPFSIAEVKGAEELTSPVTGTSKQQQTTGEHLSVCLYVHTSACVLDFINIPDIYMSVGVDLCTCVHVHVCMPLSIFPTCLFTPFLPLCGCRGQRCRRGSFYL